MQTCLECGEKLEPQFGDSCWKCANHGIELVTTEESAKAVESETENAEDLLKRSLFSYLLEIIWRSALATILFLAVKYLFGRRALDLEYALGILNLEYVLGIFALSVVASSIITFLVLLLAAGNYRKRNGSGRDTKSSIE